LGCPEEAWRPRKRGRRRSRTGDYGRGGGPAVDAVGRVHYFHFRDTASKLLQSVARAVQRPGRLLSGVGDPPCPPNSPAARRRSFQALVTLRIRCKAWPTRIPMARGPSRTILSEWFRLRLSSLKPQSRPASGSRTMRCSSSGVSSGSPCSLVFADLGIGFLCTSWSARRRLRVQKNAPVGTCHQDK